MSSSFLLSSLAHQTTLINETFYEHVDNLKKLIALKKRNWESIYAFLFNLKDYETFIFCLRTENLNTLAQCLESIKNALENEKSEKKDSIIDFMTISKKEIKSIVNYYFFPPFILIHRNFLLKLFSF